MLGVQVLITGIVVDGRRKGCYKHLYITSSDPDEAARLACEKVFKDWDQSQTDHLVVRSTKVWAAEPEDDKPGDVWFDARPWYKRWFSRD